MAPDPRDVNLARLVQSMVDRPEYLLPLAAADKQYRDHYYRLNAAALLEDLFFDALGNFVRQTEPNTSIVRAPSGGLEWDYSIDGWRVSHKVLSKSGQVAVHWDATVQNVGTWTATCSVMIVLSRSDPAVWSMTDATTTARYSAIAPDTTLRAGRRLVVLDWSPDPQAMTAEVRGSHLIESGATAVDDVLSFRDMWAYVAATLRNDLSISNCDVLVTQAKATDPPIGATLQATNLDLPSGIYILPMAYFDKVAVTANNRSAKLVEKPAITAALRRAIKDGLFVRLPLWYRSYAARRPPDLYAAQRAEYDALFSARGAADP